MVVCKALAAHGLRDQVESDNGVEWIVQILYYHCLAASVCQIQMCKLKTKNEIQEKENKQKIATISICLQVSNVSERNSKQIFCYRYLVFICFLLIFFICLLNCLYFLFYFNLYSSTDNKIVLHMRIILKIIVLSDFFLT